MGSPKNSATARQADTEMQDEIEKIMSDIQDLTDRIDDVPKSKSTQNGNKLRLVKQSPELDLDINPSEATGLEDFHAQGDEPSMEETLGQLKAEPDDESGTSLLDEAIETEKEQVEADIEAQLNVNQIEEDLAEAKAKEEASMEDDTEAEYGGSGDQCLSMTLTGNMTLKLKYDFEGQEVTIGFSGGALLVKMSDGTEFKVPVRSKKPLKRVA